MLAALWGRRWPAAALVAGIVLAGGAAAGCAATRPPHHDYGTVPAATAIPGRHASPAASAKTTTAGAAVSGTAVPVRVVIPALGVDAPVVTIDAAGRSWRYVVQAVRAYPKATLPAARVFGQQVAPRLVIVTCGGTFDAATGHYRDNIVVWAVPAR